jgi:hypothetical protein
MITTPPGVIVCDPLEKVLPTSTFLLSLSVFFEEFEDASWYSVVFDVDAEALRS